jgi:hypothetical protein
MIMRDNDIRTSKIILNVMYHLKLSIDQNLIMIVIT